jgi:hypothetical protein
MWVIEESARVTMQTREREAERARLVSEARRQTRQDAWQWRVESGMDGAFRNLLGWLLSSQRDAPVEPASDQQRAAPATLENAALAARDGVSNWHCCSSGCCA